MTAKEIGRFLFHHHEHPLAWMGEDAGYDPSRYSDEIYYREKDVIQLLRQLGYDVNFDWYPELQPLPNPYDTDKGPGDEPEESQGD